MIFLNCNLLQKFVVAEMVDPPIHKILMISEVGYKRIVSFNYTT